MANGFSSKRGVILLFFLFVLCAAILFALFFHPKSSRLPSSIPAPQQAPVARPAPVTPPAMGTEPQEPRSFGSLQAQAKRFGERYGSFSTEANYANLRDLEPFMTDGFAAKTEASIRAAKAPAQYYGVTTRVVSVTNDFLDEKSGQATWTLATQRSEVKGNTPASVRYQEMMLTFVKVGEVWKVDAAVWK